MDIVQLEIENAVTKKYELQHMGSEFWFVWFTYWKVIEWHT
jgi:hypothetical protein